MINYTLKMKVQKKDFEPKGPLRINNFKFTSFFPQVGHVWVLQKACGKMEFKDTFILV